MKSSMLTMCGIFILLVIGIIGCDSEENTDDTNPWDDNNTDTGEVSKDEYICISEDVDISDCGEYPESEAWDLGKVIPNMTFEAFYDRDCDGVREATTLDLYRDVYCQRDKIKSLVMVVGSNCGDTGQACET